MKATFIKQLKKGFKGDARLYKLDPPLLDIEYVVVSATIPVFGGGPETYIFKSSNTGEVKYWGELEGSFRGGLDHIKALAGMGYEVE